MKTLIIHLEDPTTSFVKEFYEDFDWTVINDPNIHPQELHYTMIEHDRVFVIGHGIPLGLLRPYNSQLTSDLVLDWRWVDVLKEIPEVVYFWCNADSFVKSFELKGFNTGMFISDIHEARFCIEDEGVTQEMMDEANKLLIDTLKETGNLTGSEFYEAFTKKYRSADYNDNPIIRYNEERVYYAN